MIDTILAGLAALLVAASSGSGLDKLWKEYDKASGEDRPQEQLEILGRIKAEASAEHRVWDFYRACSESRNVAVRLDWKKRDALDEALLKEITDSGEPVALAYHLKDAAGQWPGNFLKDNRRKLQSSRNPEFWANDWRINSYSYGKVLSSVFENDYDYACWVAGEDSFEGRYPLDALREYSKLDNTEATRAFADKYRGCAVSLLAVGDILWKDYYSLEQNGGRSADFLALKARCEEFNRERKAYTGIDRQIAQVCDEADALLTAMEESSLEAWVENGVLVIGLRNLSRATAVITDGKKEIFRHTFDNPVGSYHATDSIRYALPDWDDGEYRLNCTSGKHKVESSYCKHTLAVAVKRDVRGAHAFVADHMSGEPVGGKLYEAISAGTLNYRYSFRDARGRLRCSDEIAVNTSPLTQDLTDARTLRCLTLLDRSLYSKGDEIKFKGILYKGTYTIENVGAGTGTEAVLTDAGGKELARIKLTTNEFGSVAGSFRIPASTRNGTARLALWSDGRCIGYETARVEDIEVPTFDLEFDGSDYERLDTVPDSLKVSGSIVSYSGHSLSDAVCRYTVNGVDGIVSGDFKPDANGRFAFSFKTRKVYFAMIEVKVSVTDAGGETQSFSKVMALPGPGEPEAEKEHYFEELDTREISLKIVAADKPVWAVVDLYGEGNVLLDERMIHFKPVDGKAETTVSYAYADSYPDVVTMEVLYFQDGRCFRHSMCRRREIKVWDLPLDFERFTDMARPGQECRLRIKTGPATECALAVFDKATESISPNVWSEVRGIPLPEPHSSTIVSPGCNDSHINILEGGTVPYRTKTAIMSNMAADEAPVRIRKDFSTSLAWEPLLHSDANGVVDFSFKAGDRLSTFAVQVFAHNKAMQNAVLRRELLITIPVRISLFQPEFLYCGDRYLARAVVSNSTEEPISGRIVFDDGRSEAVTVPAHGQSSASYEVCALEPGNVPIKAVFIADKAESYSDGILVNVPVMTSGQTLTEAHSALLLPGKDKAAEAGRLRSQFVNMPGADAVMSTISILDMVKDAIPGEIKPKGNNLLSICRAIKAMHLLEDLPGELASSESGAGEEDLTARLESYRNADGGYAWFPGLNSSPILTATALECLGDMLPEASRAVSYLDSSFIEGNLQYWQGGISLEQYLHVRAMFADVPLNVRAGSGMRKKVREYLVPVGERGLEGQILRKARRIETLRRLGGSDEGKALASELGISLFAGSRMSRSESKDMKSLSQYAVRHSSGGIYFPNAVTPWRGLLESELYAHNMLSRIFEGYDDSISDGIRLWTMIQKETQHWESDPAYLEAIQNVLEAPEEILAAEVLVLKGSSHKALDSIVADGNGFGISSSSPASGGTGDIVTVEYTIRNDENRSFVKLRLPYPAALTPVNSLSGPRSWNGYREVQSDAIEYWFDSYPEGTATIKEDFYITREGSFQCPVPIVECTYADHYRANEGSRPIFNAQK